MTRVAGDLALRAELMRFIPIGLLNAAFGYFAFATLIFLGIHYSLAALLSTVIGVGFNFRTTGRYVFGVDEPGLLWRFYAVYAFVYAANLVCLFLLNAGGINNYLAGALLVGPLGLLAFSLIRAFVFKGRRQ